MQKQGAVKGILCIAITAILVGSVQAQSNSVSIFKNGTAFVKISDTVHAVNGLSVIPVPEDAAFGTLWLSSASASIASMTSVEGNIPGKEEDFENIREMLQYNIGKKVRLVLAYQDPQEAVLSSLVNNYAVFRAKDRWITTDITKIETIEFLDQPLMSEPKKGRLIQVSWENIQPAQQYSMMYMRQGLGWVPEYLLEISSSNTAHLKLQASVVNDGISMKNTELNLVVGVPNFLNGEIKEPFASSEGIKELLDELNGQPGERDDNIMLSNMVSIPLDASKNSKNPSGDAEKGAEGSQTEDFYIYTLKNVSLEKGERMSIPLLEAEVPVRHIYSAEIPSNVDQSFRFSATSKFSGTPTSVKSDMRENNVYHSIELTNQTSKPWTTGSAMLVSNEKGEIKPVAQDILPYAPKGGKTQFRITVAPDIKVSDQEQEVSRDPDQKRKNGETYDLVTIEAQVSVKNYKDKPVVLDISRTIYGELLKSDADWQSVKELSLSDPNNPKNNVSWELSLQPNDEKTITYKYTLQLKK